MVAPSQATGWPPRRSWNSAMAMPLLLRQPLGRGEHGQVRRLGEQALGHVEPRRARGRADDRGVVALGDLQGGALREGDAADEPPRARERAGDLRRAGLDEEAVGGGVLGLDGQRRLAHPIVGGQGEDGLKSRVAAVEGLPGLAILADGELPRQRVAPVLVGHRQGVAVEDEAPALGRVERDGAFAVRGRLVPEPLGAEVAIDEVVVGVALAGVVRVLGGQDGRALRPRDPRPVLAERDLGERDAVGVADPSPSEGWPFSVSRRWRVRTTPSCDSVSRPPVGTLSVSTFSHEAPVRA